MDDRTRTTTPAQDHLEREMAEVEAAISLVESGAAARVSLTGLGHGEALVAALRAAAAEVGVVIEPIWGWEDGRSDLLVRKMEPGPSGEAEAPSRD
jgi:hypothetical protein